MSRQENLRKQIPFIADKNTANTIDNAYQSAILFGDAAITKTGSVVSSFECVEYQLRAKNVLIRFTSMQSGLVRIVYFGDLL